MTRLVTICAGLIAVAIWPNAAICKGDVFAVPLQVNGTYYTNGQSKSFSFDLGTALSEVHSMTFVCDGLITAGVDHYGAPFSWDLLAYLDSESLLPLTALVARGGESTYPNPEPFSTQNPFIAYNWNFLLDGKASGFVQPIGMGIIVGNEPQVMPEFTINNASLIIDAEPVPEPATLLLLGIGGLILLKRK